MKQMKHIFAFTLVLLMVTPFSVSSAGQESKDTSERLIPAGIRVGR